MSVLEAVRRVIANLVLARSNLFAAANWIRGEGVLKWEYVGWPEYLTAIFLCTGGLVALN